MTTECLEHSALHTVAFRGKKEPGEGSSLVGIFGPGSASDEENNRKKSKPSCRFWSRRGGGGGVPLFRGGGESMSERT